MKFIKSMAWTSIIVFATIIFIFSPSAQARHNETAESTVNKTADEVRSESMYTPQNASKPVLQNNFRVQMDKLTKWPVKRIDESGTLLFSDSPETVYQDGILYRDTVTGKGRLYYYHVNGTDKRKKVVVMLSNKGNDLAHFNITRSAQSGPSTDYLYVGKTSQIRYFSYQVPRQIIIGKNKPELLEDNMNTILVRKDELVCGIYDFSTDQSVEITVMMMPLDDDPYQFLKRAAVLPKDESRLRGTFKNMDRILQGEQYYNPEKDGAVSITVADDKDDKYLTGIDATDGTEAKNYGNYGVIYYLDIPTSGMGKIHYYLQPLGGVYAGAVAVRVNDERGLDLIPTPSERAFFGENSKQLYYADLGVYNARDNVLFEYSPPGASNLPVNIILTPAQ
ncbi:copper amine oxidase [Pectinatus frisingensis]|uniref:copper amine oxidase n=1 Tax=Pectinatus frisingensis TaxID=865 RepID=UPI0015F6CC5B|nr:copper amine oxidase [Pectinatus frisingensis]